MTRFEWRRQRALVDRSIWDPTATVEALDAIVAVYPDPARRSPLVAATYDRLTADLAADRQEN